MNQLKKLLSDIYAAYARLQPRERKLVAVGGAFLSLVVIILVSMTVSSNLSKREARLQTKLTQLEDFRRSMGSFKTTESRRTQLETQLKGTPIKLFSVLEEQAKKQGIEIGGMVDKGVHPVGDAKESKLNEISVELTLNRLALDKLVNFLSEIEASKSLVKVTKIQIRPRTGESLIDVSLTVSTYQLAA